MTISPLLRGLQVTDCFKQLGRLGQFQNGEGPIVRWLKYTNLSAATTALSEGKDPDAGAVTSTFQTAIASQYGYVVMPTDIFELVSVDPVLTAIIELLADQSAQSIDQIIQAVLAAGGTAQYGTGVVARNSLVSTDVYSVAGLRKAIRTLKRYDIRPHSNGEYVAVLHPSQVYDIQGDTKWEALTQYTTAGIDRPYNGDIGKLYGTRFIETSECTALTASGSASTNLIASYVFGAEAFGVTDLQNLATYVDSPDPTSALRMRSRVGWKASFAAKVLNASAYVRLETGFTA
jgi:N4-gp56 family major capsid protein